jgi:hypothetical protein
MLTSCKYADKVSNNIHPADSLLTKTIVFPNSLSRLVGNRVEKADSFKFEIEDKKKIISIVDGTCMKCIIDQLNVMDSTFNSILPDDNSLMIFILNVTRADSAYFMLNLQPSIRAAGILLWDNNYNFESQNNLFTTDSNLRTFMTDSEDKIIQYGNPIMNPGIISEYREKLTK